MRTSPFAIAVLMAANLIGQIPDAASASEIDFAHDIYPILKSHCAKCHSNGTYKGDFSLDNRQTMLESTAIVPGSSSDSEFVDRLTTADLQLRMPKSSAKLSSEEIGLLNPAE